MMDPSLASGPSTRGVEENSTDVVLILNPALRCGIREHTGFYTKWTKTRLGVVSQDPDALCHDSTIEDIARVDPSVVHIQHEFSLFKSHDALERMIHDLRTLGYKVILDFHTGGMIDDHKRALKRLATLPDRVVVHATCVAEELASFCTPIEIPLALPDDAMWAAEVDDLLEDDGPIVGAFGMFHEHKGFIQLAEALNLVRRKIPDVKLLIMGHHAGAVYREKYYRRVKQVAGRGPHVIVDRFCPIDEVVRTLAVCDVVASLYPIDVPSQSGSVDILLLSGRPCVLTTSRMLMHVPDDHIAGRIPFDAGAPQTSRSLLRILEANRTPHPVREARRRLLKHRGCRIAPIYDAIYEDLSL